LPLTSFPNHLIVAIDRIIDRYGKMKDSASPELARIRKDIAQSQGSVSRALHAILRQAQAEGLLDKDAAPTMREGRLVLPVPPAYKRKIGGIVHDESATGKTVFVEP
jgi:DNA mismatch repair protein MutS2